jgi:hypothetical protein
VSSPLGFADERFQKKVVFNNVLLLDYKYAVGSGQHFLLSLGFSEKRPVSTMNLY